MKIWLRCVVRSMVPSTLSPNTASRWRCSGHSICSMEASNIFMRAATDGSGENVPTLLFNR